MIKKHYSAQNVVEAAKQRVINLFRTAPRVSMSVSGGKDSICLNDIVFKLVQNGKIDKEKLVIDFIDEEAIFPCVEKTVREIRLQWLSLGVPFRWWTIQCKHFNCFNQLQNDESFICWDETKRDVWVREKPPFSISTHKLLRPRKETYQEFMARLSKSENAVQISGVRVSESIQRQNAVASRKNTSKVYPIYDWMDSDVWNYIRQNNLNFPEAYIYMYQCGANKKQMRISQFFSVDTAGTLVQMCEYYPNLFDKICLREPNAYMAMLYWDTEFYRHVHEKGKSDNEDYKKKLFDVLKESWRFETDSMKKLQGEINNMLIKYGTIMTNSNYKRLYGAVLAGDPKSRTVRATLVDIFAQYHKREG